MSDKIKRIEVTKFSTIKTRGKKLKLKIKLKVFNKKGYSKMRTIYTNPTAHFKGE